MSTNTSKLSPTELDFDLIKSELKTYLNSQDEFSEYNFEGSALNVLMDVLAYNTHMNAFMANMMGNEMFLDSATIRQSVVSKAKEIGYTSRSIRSSKSIVNIKISGVSGNPPQILMDAGTQFQTKFDMIFSTKEDRLLYPTTDPTVYEIQNTEIFEGRLSNFSYIVDLNNVDQRFIIPSVDVDTSTIRVLVKPNKDSSIINEYFLNNDINQLNPESPVYFIHETPEGYYEITFGDGILGKKLINGNYIMFSYVISFNKADANGIKQFIPYQRIGGYSGITIDTIETSYGGSEKESIDDIKFLAPKMYQSQKRAVTIEDYETFLLHDYPWIDTINSWGGENNNPPIYGKVFFAIKPKHTEFVSEKLKLEIINDLINKYNVVTVVPEIINPDYIYINIDTVIFYVYKNTTLDESELINKTLTTIYNYFTKTTEKFKMDFKFSPLISEIDNTDQSFDSSLSDIIFHKRIYPLINTSQTFELKYNNEIEPGTIYSSHFNVIDISQNSINYEVRIEDDGKGNMRLIQVSNNGIVDSNIGTVDYTNGTISITIFPYSLPLDTLDIRIYATPKYKNIVSGYNQIIVPDDSSVNYDYNRRQGITVTMNKIES